MRPDTNTAMLLLLACAGVLVVVLMGALAWQVIALARAVERFGRTATESERKIAELSRRAREMAVLKPDSRETPDE